MLCESEKCFKCEFEVEKTCRRYPPIVLSNFNQGFPSLVEFNEGCGEWKLKNELFCHDFADAVTNLLVP